jgi:hypothetical protein
MFRSRENDSRVLYLETKVPSALESTHMRESERERLVTFVRVSMFILISNCRAVLCLVLLCLGIGQVNR